MNPALRQRMKLVFQMLSALAVSGLAIMQVSAADEPVRVEPTKTIFSSDEKIELRVVNGGDDLVFIPGCGALQPEVFIDDRYEVLPPPFCEGEGQARALGPGETLVVLSNPVGLEGKIGRVSMVYGTKCLEGRRLSRARCKNFSTVWSGNFRLKATPSE